MPVLSFLQCMCYLSYNYLPNEFILCYLPYLTRRFVLFTMSMLSVLIIMSILYIKFTTPFILIIAKYCYSLYTFTKNIHPIYATHINYIYRPYLQQVYTIYNILCHIITSTIMVHCSL